MCYRQQHEQQFAKRFGELVKALTEKQVPFEGVQQRLLNLLQPITYDDDLSRHLLRFTGREWVMEEVEEWLASSRRVLWITGEAGIGKSALAAWLCNKRAEISAYHFCRFGNSDRIDARKALFSLAYQLSTQLPVYQDRLNASPLDKTAVETNVPAVFDRLFVNLLSDTVALTDKLHIFLIDALDEAASNGRNELASLIGDEFHRLPSWLRVIVTSRPYEQGINFALQALDPWKLDAGRPDNLDDIRKYLRFELQPFTGNGAPSEDVVNAVVEKSEGLFLYVSWVRQELQDGRLSLKEIETFPRGLGGMFAAFFQRYFPDLREYGVICRPALEAICAVREPLERRDLALLLGRSEYEMRQLTARLGSLFPVVDGRVRPFHQSVRDWLIDPSRSGDYWIDVSAQEERLADLAWQEYQVGVNTMGRYCIKYAPSHFAACQRKNDLTELLLDPDWIKAKLEASGVTGLLSDYELGLDLLSSKPHETVAMQSAGALASTTRKIRQVSMGDSEAHVTYAPATNALRLVQGAIRLSSNVIAKDPGQFASQMVGRLIPYKDVALIDGFTKRVAEGTPRSWLHLLHPALHPPGTALIRTLADHTSYVITGVALSGDGRLAVSASYDKTLKVWEVESGRELRTLVGYHGFVYGVALSGDGRLAVAAYSDGKVKVWEVESGRELRTLSGHSSSVLGVALSRDGRLAVSAGWDGTLKVWEVESGSELRTLSGHASQVSGVALSGDGRLAVSASRDQTLKVWEVGSGALVATLSCDAAVLCCAWADHHELIIAGEDGGRVHFLRLEELRRG